VVNRRCQATDPRDKVYFLLGGSTETSHGSSDLIPDYNVSVHQTHLHATQFIMHSEKEH